MAFRVPTACVCMGRGGPWRAGGGAGGGAGARRPWSTPGRLGDRESGALGVCNCRRGRTVRRMHGLRAPRDGDLPFPVADERVEGVERRLRLHAAVVLRQVAGRGHVCEGDAPAAAVQQAQQPLVGQAHHARAVVENLGAPRPVLCRLRGRRARPQNAPAAALGASLEPHRSCRRARRAAQRRGHARRRAARGAQCGGMHRPRVAAKGGTRGCGASMHASSEPQLQTVPDITSFFTRAPRASGRTPPSPRPTVAPWRRRCPKPPTARRG